MFFYIAMNKIFILIARQRLNLSIFDSFDDMILGFY